MRKTVIILSLILSHLGFSQISHPGITSTDSATGDHAFVGTKSDGVFSNWLNTGHSATAYNLLGFTDQHAGFGVANGNNIVSPIIWMYANERNAFRVRNINYNVDMTGGTDLFTVRSSGKIGIGTTNPNEKLQVVGNISSYEGNIYLNNSSVNQEDSGVIRWNEYSENTTNKSGAFIKYNGASNYLQLVTNNETTEYEHLRMYRGGNLLLQPSFGNVGIGTTDTKGFKLGVQGKIAAEEVKVALHANWADFVFENNYKLPTLKEVEQHIKEKGHLQDIPSAEEVAKNGIFLGEMDAKLLQKIEELTLYTIAQEKKIKKQSSKIKKQEQEIMELKSLNEKLFELQIRLEKLESKK
ncbi:hypothetical protein [Flavivirga sp. 57AJ16]|uniref:hypothetical protein n=1 Tax=Flavivirga sp. 57AJ16 TaxID=3025307 RepID=UPI0023664721|nr:hypothetical protein [Flavivirga sp. 57AJ16]MDD7886048.1 hypothetical protein [Flavivirga sp. 57AJ16]